jgi:hypothetical protein
MNQKFQAKRKRKELNTAKTPYHSKGAGRHQGLINDHILPIFIYNISSLVVLLLLLVACFSLLD